jgi:hypothetical protein
MGDVHPSDSGPCLTLEKFAMKKSLIALAVVAVSSTAFAQSSVSLTGKLRFAYGQTETAAGVKGRGVGVTDGDWNINATEDLGGGLKATASMALRLRGRDAATDATSTGVGARPRDSFLMLSGGFGSVMIGAVEAGNATLGFVTAGGPTYIGLDNGVAASATSNVDILQYTSPSMNGFSAKVATIDAVGGNGSQDGGAVTLYGVNYANGPLAAMIDMTSYGTAAAASADQRTRAGVSYDLGMARVGLGMESNNNGAAADADKTLFSVSVPMGAITLGGVYATTKTDGAGTAKGYDLSAQYALSKRTYVALQTQSIKAAGANAATATRVQLAHSF